MRLSQSRLLEWDFQFGIFTLQKYITQLPETSFVYLSKNEYVKIRKRRKIYSSLIAFFYKKFFYFNFFLL